MNNTSGSFLIWWLCASTAWAIALSACSGGEPENEELAACEACASMSCPDESAACDTSATCNTLRSCTLACPEGDSACQNDCVEDAASDSNAILTAANLVACAHRECPQACSAAANTGAGGTGTAGGATTSGGSSTSGASSTTGGSGTSSGGRSQTPPARCQDLIDWATGCAVDTESPFQACDSQPLSLCNAGCYIGATCDEYQANKAGTRNELSTCLDYCELAHGGGTTVADCATANAKRFACDVPENEECDDADPLNQCQNQCVLDHDCDAIRGTPLTGNEDAYANCFAACSANTGGENPNFVVDEGGYVTTLNWHGYAWTATDGVSGSTITPADFSAVPAGGQLCVSGTVAGTADYSAVAMLGLNLNQEPGMPAPDPENWSTRDQGVYYNITNNAGTPLRIQIQAADGDTDPTRRWCADVTAQSGEIFWHSFDTECWEGGAGTAFVAGNSLLSIAVLVPGDIAARPFDFCVYELSVDG